MLNLVPFSIDLSLDKKSWDKPSVDTNTFPGIKTQALGKFAIILILRNYLRRSPAKIYHNNKKLSMNETAPLKSNFWFLGVQKGVKNGKS
jgi:hypothetical protein